MRYGMRSGMRYGMLQCVFAAGIFLLAASSSALAFSGDEEGLSSLYRRASSGVVVVFALSPEGKGMMGSGIVLSREGLVLTNAHVVTLPGVSRPGASGGRARTLRVYFRPEKTTGNFHDDLTRMAPARLLSISRRLDLALLSVGPVPSDVRPLRFVSSRGISPGTRVLAIGHPEQGGLWTLTSGIVSARIDDLGGVIGKEAFQTDASINRGNSGGPLLDRRGRVIGVNTAIARKGSDGLAITSVNFAIRSGVVRRWLGAKLPVEVAEKLPQSPESLLATPFPGKPSDHLADHVSKQGAGEVPDKAQEGRIVTPFRSSPVPYREQDALRHEKASLIEMGDRMQEKIRETFGSK